MNTIVLTAHCPAGHVQTIRILGGTGAALLAAMLEGECSTRCCATCGQPMGPFLTDEEIVRPSPGNGAAVGK